MADVGDRIARWVSRCGKRVEEYAVSIGEEELARVPAGSTAVEDLVALLDDAAALRGATITARISALAEERPLASMVIRYAHQTPTTEPSSTVVRVLTQHTQELTRILVQSQAQLLAAYREVLRVVEARARDAEERAAAAEMVAAEVATEQPTNGHLATEVLTRLLPSLGSSLGSNGNQAA